MSFHALVLDRSDDELRAGVRTLRKADLPDGDVLVRVQYSSLNYKDGLAITGKGKIIRGAFPFVPGIDLVGEVEADASGTFAPGTLVIGTGWGIGESHWGGYSQRQRVDAHRLVGLPEGLSPRAAMAIGTAGLTAMLSVMALEAHGLRRQDHGEVVVTGASGGVGSAAVALLASAGYQVVAATGSADAHAYLRGLGAARIIDRAELARPPERPLGSARWRAAVDTVGGDTLASVLTEVDRHGAVAACGNAGGAHLHTTVFPFILRGVNLLGIDSNTCPNDRRAVAWQRLTRELPASTLDGMTEVIGLADLPRYAETITQGRIRGRVVVDMNR